MNVVIDVTPLESGHKFRGIGAYTKQLVEALKNHKSEHLFTFITRGQKVPENTNLIHYPFFDPFFLTLPLIKKYPTVVTVHDLIPIVHRTNFQVGLRGLLKWQIQKMSLRSVDAIITDSEASKRDIFETVGFALNKIHVVYLAPSDLFKRKASKKIYSRFKRYLLFVGDVNWNKNVLGLLNIFAKIKQRIRDIKLVLVGRQFLNKDLLETQIIDKRINDLSLDTSVYKLGFVSNDELASLYSSAAAYIQPSFAEGFGFPVLEAMACGCPVVCSNTSSLPEIAGPGKLVNPYDEKECVEGIIEVLTYNTLQRELLTKKGLLWVKKFNWHRVAKETIRVYESIFE